MRYFPFYLNLIRRLLALKGLKPTNPATIDIIGYGWHFGETALSVANRIIAHEHKLDDAAHDG